VNNELEKMWKEVVVVYFSILSKRPSGRIQERHEIFQISIVDPRAESTMHHSTATFDSNDGCSER
jgi:hypothetical protein